MPSTPHSAGTPESGPARRRRSSRGVLRKALLCSVAIAGVTPTLLAEAPPAKKQEAPPRVSALRCGDRKSTRLNSSHDQISYAVFCLKKKKKQQHKDTRIPADSEDQTDDEVESPRELS